MIRSIGLRRAWPAAVLVVLVWGECLLPCPLLAQVHHLDEAPWHVLDAGPSRQGVDFFWIHGRDPATDWSHDRLGLTIFLPVGARGLFFLREDHVRFDTGEQPVLSRWPQVQPVDPDAPDAGDPDWPGESILKGFGRPEVGLFMPMRLPLLGAGHLNLTAGLPVGDDRLYPFAPACLPLRLDWRRTVFAEQAALRAAIRVGWERTYTAFGEELDAEAFPGGWRYGLEVRTGDSLAGGLKLAWNARELADQRHHRDLTLAGWLPLGGGHRVQLQATRSFAEKVHRHAAWSIGLTWHLAGPFQEDAPPANRRGQNAADDGWPASP